MYYIAPASFVFLALPWSVIEAQALFADKSVRFDPLIFISNAAAAFGLNMSVFLLIGKTSALTMNVAGVIKDWMLIGLSVLLFHTEVGCLALGGKVRVRFRVRVCECMHVRARTIISAGYEDSQKSLLARVIWGIGCTLACGPQYFQGEHILGSSKRIYEMSGEHVLRGIENISSVCTGFKGIQNNACAWHVAANQPDSSLCWICCIVQDGACFASVEIVNEWSL